MRPKQFVANHLLNFGIFSVLLFAPYVSFAAAAETAPIQGANAVVDPFPLRPPDTSSPRDTLRSFLENVNMVAEAWRRGAVSNATDRAWMSALMALDFSATPDSDSWSVQTERALLLMEIIDRVEVPPESKIPGDADVEKEHLTQWTIPNTKITIARVENGPRAGEFLFTADTVERLFRSYLLVRNLPYKRTPSTPGIYEEYTSSDQTIFALERQLRLRLGRVDTSSPRSTLRAFTDNVDQAYGLVMNADKALKAKPPRMTTGQAIDVERTADDHLRRAAATFDLSRIPEAYRKAASIEIVLKLKEVLDRTLLPSLENVPDRPVVVMSRQQQNQSPSLAARPYRWRYPNTEIEIVEIMEGDRQGEFLFSASTVSRINDFYDQVRSLPYRSEISGAQESKYVWSKDSKGFYDYFITNPGYLVPRASILGGLVDALPGSFKSRNGGLMIWQWIGLLLALLVVVLAAGSAFRSLRHLASKSKPPFNEWLMILFPVLLLSIIVGLNRFFGEGLHITGELRTAITTCLKVIGIILVIWVVTKLCIAIAETVIATPRIRDRSLDASLLRISVRIAAFVIGGWIIIVAVRDLGADLLPLLAGLGVGGLAVALAAQRTLANFIGSLILFANKPVKPGDFCRYSDQIGTVENIGLLSTRIRTIERTIVTVPNAEFSEIKLENFAVRDRRLLRTTLQLRYETTPEQMRYILAKLRELLLRHPKVTPEPARVRFVGYGAYSKDVEIFAYLDTTDHNTFLGLQEDVLLRIEDVISEAGSGLAFPSQTTYLSRDKGLDAERGGKAEARVQQWRGAGKLPFPEFAAEDREQIKDTLDYPPKGSPDYEPPKISVGTDTTKGPATVSVDDFINLASFAAKLQERTQVADYVWGLLSVKTQELLSGYDNEADSEVREALVKDLNAIIQGPSIYAVDRFSEIKRRPETQDLLEANPKGQDLARLNRLLLEDAFPKELAGTVTATRSTSDENSGLR